MVLDIDRLIAAYHAMVTPFDDYIEGLIFAYHAKHITVEEVDDLVGELYDAVQGG